MRAIAVLACLMLLLSVSGSYAITFVIINNNPAPPTAEYLVSSTPTANQSLDKAPEIVSLTFSRPILPDKSSIKVYDLYGTQINDDTLTVNVATMSASLPPLSPGKYSVKWKTRCQCEDQTNLKDEFHFTVRPPSSGNGEDQ